MHKFRYNILFTSLMSRGRAPNGIGHLMILPSFDIAKNADYLWTRVYECRWSKLIESTHNKALQDTTNANAF